MQDNDVFPCAFDGKIRAEARQRALDFVREWQEDTREQAEAKPFWVDFFSIFGIKRRRVAAFEQPGKRADRRHRGHGDP